MQMSLKFSDSQKTVNCKYLNNLHFWHTYILKSFYSLTNMSRKNGTVMKLNIKSITKTYDDKLLLWFGSFPFNFIVIL